MCRFRQNERISLNREVSRIVGGGSRFSYSFLTLIWVNQENKQERTPLRRIAIRVMRKTGNAVIRNRIKRTIRECFRHEKENIRPSIDFLMIVKPFSHPGRITTAEMRKNFISLCKKSGLWLKNSSSS